MSLPDALASALDTMGDDAESLRAAWTAPYTVAIVGMTGVGKTTLANRLTEQAAPTGLGGVTRGVQPLYGSRCVVLDTEGIDDTRIARAILAAPLQRADAVIWVLDGRAPSTASERQVVTELLPEHTPVHVIVGRADLLEPEERDAVLARVHRLHAGAASIIALDLRTDPIPDALTSTELPSSPRIAQMHDALERAIAALPGPPDSTAFLHDLRRAWRSTAHSVRDAVLADVKSGTLADATTALATVQRAAHRARTHVGHALEHDPFLDGHGVRPPQFPKLEATDESPIHALIAGMGGQAAAKRAVTAATAQWFSDGDMALLDWQTDHLEPALARRAAQTDSQRLLLRAAQESLPSR
ncbi:MAG: 50S ribosome-binding GTPase [Proteobacteria bacterium]|nr:50S ribosome-binding GTPase [Pseudomonadota bacterium]